VLAQISVAYLIMLGLTINCLTPKPNHFISAWRSTTETVGRSSINAYHITETTSNKDTQTHRYTMHTCTKGQHKNM